MRGYWNIDLTTHCLDLAVLEVAVVNNGGRGGHAMLGVKLGGLHMLGI